MKKKWTPTFAALMAAYACLASPGFGPAPILAEEAVQEVGQVGYTVEETDASVELTYSQPCIILDDDLAQVAITGAKLEYGQKVWYYYTIKNKSQDTYINEFFQNESFGDFMVDYSSYNREGSGDAIPGGKNSGRRGKGSSDVANVKSVEDLKNFSGTLRIYPSDDPNSYGGSHGQDYSISFEVHADDLPPAEAAADVSDQTQVLNPDEIEFEGASLIRNADSVELVYEEPVAVEDDDTAQICMTGLKLEYGQRIWFYYTIKNQTSDLYLNEFVDSLAFNGNMVDFSSYNSEGSSGSVPPGKNSGVRGKGGFDVANLHSAADLQNFSGVFKIYPSDDPSSYGGSHGEMYSIPFEINLQQKGAAGAEADAGQNVEELAPDAGSAADSLPAYLPEVNPDVSYEQALQMVYDYVAANGETQGDGSCQLAYDTGLADAVYQIRASQTSTGTIGLDFCLEYAPSSKSIGDFVLHYDNMLSLTSMDDLLASTYLHNYVVQASSGQSGLGAEGTGQMNMSAFTPETRLSLDQSAAPDVGQNQQSVTTNEGESLTYSFQAAEEPTEEMLSSLQDGQNVIVEELQKFLADANLGISIGNLGFTAYEITPSRVSGIRAGEMPGVVAKDYWETSGDQAQDSDKETNGQDSQEPAIEEGVADTKPPAEDTAQEEIPAMDAEMLEAQLSQQPVHVVEAEVTNTNDSRFAFGSGYRSDIILAKIYNGSADSIKDANVYYVGWDANNLPVIMKSGYINYDASYTPHIYLQGINLVSGATSNQYDADTFDVFMMNDTCNVYKAKAIVAAYSTYSGDVWKNPLIQDWIDTYGGKPLEEAVVYTDQETVKKVQEALNAAGYNCGTPDGIPGNMTYQALNQYQTDHGLAVKNEITDKLLQAMGLQ